MLVTLFHFALAVLLSAHSGNATSGGRRVAVSEAGSFSAQGGLLRTEKEPSDAEMASLAADSTAKASDADAAMQNLMASMGQDSDVNDKKTGIDADLAKLTDAQDSSDSQTNGATKDSDDNGEMNKLMASLGQSAQSADSKTAAGDNDDGTESNLDKQMAELDTKSANLDDALKELNKDNQEVPKTKQQDSDSLGDMKGTDTDASLSASLLEVQSLDTPITTSFFTQYTDRLSSHFETRMTKMETHIKLLQRQVELLQKLLGHKQAHQHKDVEVSSLLELSDVKPDDADDSKWLDRELEKIGNKWRTQSNQKPSLSQDSQFGKDEASSWLDEQVKDQTIDPAADKKWLDKELEKMKNQQKDNAKRTSQQQASPF